jgi:hypothetical protein
MNETIDLFRGFSRKLIQLFYLVQEPRHQEFRQRCQGLEP